MLGESIRLPPTDLGPLSTNLASKSKHSVYPNHLPLAPVPPSFKSNFVN
jgi:hypothetical protein